MNREMLGGISSVLAAKAVLANAELITETAREIASYSGEREEKAGFSLDKVVYCATKVAIEELLVVLAEAGVIDGEISYPASTASAVRLTVLRGGKDSPPEAP